MAEGPEHRLAVYGSLAPGEVNARVLEPLEGEWLEGGHLRGRLQRTGWGAAHGFPGLEWDPEGGLDVGYGWSRAISHPPSDRR